MTLEYFNCSCCSLFIAIFSSSFCLVVFCWVCSMLRILIFKLRFSVLSFFTMSWVLVSCSVNRSLSSFDASKRVDNCRLDKFLGFLGVCSSLSVGAFFLDPEMTDNRLARKVSFKTFRLAGFVAFLSNWAFACLSFYSSTTNWEAGTGMSRKSAVAFSLYPRLQCSAQIWPEC